MSGLKQRTPVPEDWYNAAKKILTEIANGTETKTKDWHCKLPVLGNNVLLVYGHGPGGYALNLSATFQEKGFLCQLRNQTLQAKKTYNTSLGKWCAYITYHQWYGTLVLEIGYEES